MDLQTTGQASSDRLSDKITERENEFVKALDAQAESTQRNIYIYMERARSGTLSPLSWSAAA